MSDNTIFQTDLTVEDVARILFEYIDQEKRGYITLEDICAYQEINDDPFIKALYNNYDENRSGGIEFNEFAVAFSDLLNPDTDNIYKKLFDVYDQDKDGYLTETEFKALHNATGDQKSDFKSVFRRMDSDRDGKISKNEFLGNVA